MVKASENGYINKDLFQEFGAAFVSFLKKEGLMTGLPHHYAHLYNYEFLDMMKSNNIHVFAIPSHTSHWLQPLDVGVFRSFKHGWQRAMQEFTRDTAGKRTSSLFSTKHGIMELQQKTVKEVSVALACFLSTEMPFLPLHLLPVTHLNVSYQQLHFRLRKCLHLHLLPVKRI